MTAAPAGAGTEPFPEAADVPGPAPEAARSAAPPMASAAGGTRYERMILAVGVLAVIAVVNWLQSRLAHVNAAVLFISLLFFGWLWGIWGLLIGAPLVGIIKVVCDRVESLKSTGELLGR